MSQSQQILFCEFSKSIFRCKVANWLNRFVLLNLAFAWHSQSHEPFSRETDLNICICLCVCVRALWQFLKCTWCAAVALNSYKWANIFQIQTTEKKVLLLLCRLVLILFILKFHAKKHRFHHTFSLNTKRFFLCAFVGDNKINTEFFWQKESEFWLMGLIDSRREFMETQ